MRERPKKTNPQKRWQLSILGTMKKTPIVRQQFARIANQMKPKNIITRAMEMTVTPNFTKKPF